MDGLHMDIFTFFMIDEMNIFVILFFALAFVGGYMLGMGNTFEEDNATKVVHKVILWIWRKRIIEYSFIVMLLLIILVDYTIIYWR